jgi:putative transposase
MIGKTWREAWEHVIPFLAFPPDVRRVVYTTNTTEALHRQIRKTIMTNGLRAAGARRDAGSAR